MWRTILLYAAALAVGAFVLQWLQYQYLARMFPTEIYIALIAAGFAALGAWAGYKLTHRAPPGPFQKNHAALKSLGITEREWAVLERIAAGRSNKEIARDLSVSPNTVKTHIANLFSKLEVQRRTQAIDKARALALIP